MDPATVIHDCALPGRGAGTDAERRAALVLAEALRADGRAVAIEPVWVRPQWALVHAVHVALLIAGGLLAIKVPAAGLAVTAAALVSMSLDLLGYGSPVRRVSPARATQNVVAAPAGPERPVRLVIAAGYDAPRGGLAYRARFQRWWRAAERWAYGRLPGPLAWLAIGGALLLVLAIARTAGAQGTPLDVLQLLVTIKLLVAFTLLADIALSEPGPGASDAAAAAAALAVARELADGQAPTVEVEVVLAGAATGPALGMAAYLRARRGWPRQQTIVLAIGPCGRGPARWARAEGPLVPLRCHPRLDQLAAEVARSESHLRARPFTARGLPSAAHAARVRGFASLMVCSRPETPVAPEDDAVEDLDMSAVLDVVDFCVALAGRIDRDVAARYGAPAASA